MKQSFEERLFVKLQDELLGKKLTPAARKSVVDAVSSTLAEEELATLDVSHQIDKNRGILTVEISRNNKPHEMSFEV